MNTATTAPATREQGTAANDPHYGPIIIATGRQVKTASGKAVPQPHHSKAEHIALNMEQLANFVADPAVELPANPTDADRKTAKSAVRYMVLGGLISGGSDTPITTKAERENPANDIYRRRLGNIGATKIAPFDLDVCPAALLDALTGGEAALSDEPPLTLAAVLDAFSAVAYTTPSHRPDAPRARLLVELARPVTAAEKAEICIRLEYALMQAAGATRPEGAAPGEWEFHGQPVKFDRSVTAPNQLLYCSHKGALVWLTEGQPVNVEALPSLPAHEIENAAEKSAVSGDWATPANLSPLREYLYANDLAEPHNDRTDNIICPWSDEHGSGYDFDNSTVLKVDADRTRERGYCSHDGCRQRMADLKSSGQPIQYTFFKALGVPDEILQPAFCNVAAVTDFDDLTGGEVSSDLLERDHTLSGLEPDAKPIASADPLLAVNGRAAFLTHRAADPSVPAFRQWNGITGNAYRDKERQGMADYLGIPLNLIPPRVVVKENKDGDLSYKATPHSENLRWTLYKHGAVVSRNLLSWKVEVFNPRTGVQLSDSDEKTKSLLLDMLADEGLNEKIFQNHFDAVARENSYHPIALLLHGKKWDGKPRVMDVINCVPVAPDDAEQRDVLLKTFFAGAMAAIDDGFVSLKFSPVLFSEDNDWFKTSYWARIFSICAGAFKEGISIDPGAKDSVRRAVFSWASELGELDQSTKRESGPLKAFLPQPHDEWRGEFKGHYDRKPRQTVFPASVNKAEYLHDETMASRFPAIALSAPVEIDRVNELLGWVRINDKPVLADRYQLEQFWLEVRAMRAAGLSHVLDVDSLREMKKRNDKYVDKGSYHAALSAHVYKWVNQARDYKGANPFALDDLAAGEWFSPTDATKGIGAGVGAVVYVGRALSLMARETALSKKRVAAGMIYRVNEEYYKE